MTQETALPRPVSLPAEAQAAARRGEPLIVLVSLPGCLYCERIRREHLTPMRRESGSGVVQIDLGSARTLVDFDGMTRSHDAVAPATRASRRPCCRSDRMAMNFAERLVGAGLPDFYGAYLEQRLAAARQALARAH